MAARIYGISNIAALVAILSMLAIRPGDDPTIESCTIQNGVEASNQARKTVSLPCMRWIVDSVVAAIASNDGEPRQVM